MPQRSYIFFLLLPPPEVSMLTFLHDKGNDAGRDVLEHPGRNTREKGVTDTYSSACMYPEDFNHQLSR